MLLTSQYDRRGRLRDCPVQHLREIDDIAVRDAVDIYQTQMELFVLQLLDKNRDIALTQIGTFRQTVLNHAENLLGSEFAPIAIAIIEMTHDRLREMIEARDNPDAPGY
jgi:hypothetical protein